MNKSKRYNKSKRVKRFRKTKKGGSWLNSLFGIFKSRNAQKMESNPIQGTPSNASKVPPSTVSPQPINKPVIMTNSSKVPPSTVSPSTVSPQPLNKQGSNMLPKK